jgi:hypothetical protein
MWISFIAFPCRPCRGTIIVNDNSELNVTATRSFLPFKKSSVMGLQRWDNSAGKPRGKPAHLMICYGSTGELDLSSTTVGAGGIPSSIDGARGSATIGGRSEGGAADADGYILFCAWNGLSSRA